MNGFGCKCEVKCTDSTISLTEATKRVVQTRSRQETSAVFLDRPCVAPHHHRDHSQLHSIHHQRPLATRNGHQSPVSSSVAVDAMASTKLASSSHISRISVLRINFILLTGTLLVALCLLQPIQGIESGSAHHSHQSNHYHSKHKSPILSTLMTFNELITTESIYPCLDTFDVVLMRSTDGHPSQQKQYEPKMKPAERHVAGEQNQTRQLVRVYWATKEVVDRIVSATAQHMSTDRLFPSHHHSSHRGHRRGHHRAHHHQHPHSLRPSMLIELKALNYVREYALPVKSQLVRMRCDIFEPDASIYYCFIYVILHRHAVFFESLPYCVPTTLSRDQQQQTAVAGGVNSRINEINKRPVFAAYPKLIDPHSSDDLIADMGIIGKTNDSSTRKYLNDDHGQMSGDHEAMKTIALAENDKQLDELEQIRSMILPPGPAYDKTTRKEANFLLSDNDYADPFSESDSGGGGGSHSTANSNEKDANIRQFALKSADQSDYDAERRRITAGIRQRKKVLIQTRSCYCAGQSADQHSSDGAAAVGGSRPSSPKQSLVRINLTASETTVLHLIITSCPVVADELVADDSGEVHTNYRASDNSSEALHNTDDFSEVPFDGTNQSTAKSESATPDGGLDSHMADKKLPAKHKNGKHKKQRKGKGKKGKGRMKEVSPELPSSTEWPPTSTASSSTTTEASSPSSSTSAPTVCILSIDNPYEYSFKLDNVEPSMEWPVSEANSLDFSSTIDLIDYLHQFPFLVVRNGQLSIDPQMNIENRSQTHYLRSGHLRFEALSSINVTLRFRRSAAPPPRDHNRVVKQTGTESSWTSVMATIRSLVDSTVSYIAYKVVNAESQEDSSLAQLTAFHITSMLLSLFILATLVIFAVIALQAHRANPTRPRVVQIRTPEEMNDQFCIEDNSADCSLVAPSGSNQTDEHQQQKSSIGGNCKRHDSLGSFSLEQQSLELDYYDYAVPLMVHSSSGGAGKSVTEAAIGDGDTRCNHIAVTGELPYRRSLDAHPAAFRTLPIKVNSPNRKISSTANTSMCSLAVNGVQSTTAPANHLINDAQSSVLQQTNANSSSSIATLTRLSFTKPPVLLSTFGRSD